MMELKPQELSGYTVSSNVLLQDSAYGLEKFLMVLFGKAGGWYEEYAFLQGNGTGKPLGVLNAPAAIYDPLPDYLPVVSSCQPCNNSLSCDEEYLAFDLDLLRPTAEVSAATPRHARGCIARRRLAPACL
jgi:hypothetical protein